MFAGLLIAARAQSEADDKYINIYALIQQADQLSETGGPAETLAAFADAQAQLQDFQKLFPNWNPNIVNFRLNQIADKIAELKDRMPAAVAFAPTNAVPAVNAPPLAA